MVGESIKNVEFSPEVALGFEIKSLDYVYAHPSYFRGVRMARFYQVIWIEQGEATFMVDFEQVRLRSGEMLIIVPDRSYTFDTESQYTGKLMIFTRLFLNQTPSIEQLVNSSILLNPLLPHPVVAVEKDIFAHHLAVLESELKREDSVTHQRIVHRMLEIILLAAERTMRETSNDVLNQTDLPLRYRFCNEVEKHFRQHHSVEFYCLQLGISDKALNRAAKQSVGKSAKAYIDDRVILEAKRLLSYGDSSVKEIAYTLGFSDDSNFYKFFFKHTSLTPLAFRRQYR